MFLLGEIDLTAIGELVRSHPDIVKEVDKKDGKHKYLSVVVADKKNATNGRAEYYVSMRPSGAEYSTKWFVGDLRDFTRYRNEPPRPSSPIPSSDGGDSDMPF